MTFDNEKNEYALSTGRRFYAYEVLTPSPQFWENANRYVGSKERFPLFREMATSLKYEAPRVCHLIGDDEIEEIGG